LSITALSGLFRGLLLNGLYFFPLLMMTKGTLFDRGGFRLGYWPTFMTIIARSQLHFLFWLVIFGLG
jgi:hypothetical protein